VEDICQSKKGTRRFYYMNKKVLFVIISIFSFCIYASAITPKDTSGSVIIDKIKINPEDIPEGFVYGQIPTFARKVLLNNPWLMNRAAVNRLTKNIYPRGDANSIKNMYVSIIAKKEKPFNDDIVCYIIEYVSSSSARKEIEKLSDFSRFNSDRTIVIPHGNIAVFLIVDNVNNYQYIRILKDKFENRLNSL
jgi:hypothetical protein